VVEKGVVVVEEKGPADKEGVEVRDDWVWGKNELVVENGVEGVVDENENGLDAGAKELDKEDPVLIEKGNAVVPDNVEEVVPGKVKPVNEAPVEGVVGNRELVVVGAVENRLVLWVVLLNNEPLRLGVVAAGVLDGNERLGKENGFVLAPVAENAEVVVPVAEGKLLVEGTVGKALEASGLVLEGNSEVVVAGVDENELGKLVFENKLELVCPVSVVENGVVVENPDSPLFVENGDAVKLGKAVVWVAWAEAGAPQVVWENIEVWLPGVPNGEAVGNALVEVAEGNEKPVVVVVGAPWPKSPPPIVPPWSFFLYSSHLNSSNDLSL
jgi:hypothetical protein